MGALATSLFLLAFRHSLSVRASRVPHYLLSDDGPGRKRRHHGDNKHRRKEEGTPSERRDPRAVHKSPAPRRANQFASCTGTALPKRRDPARGPLPPSDATNKEQADCLPPYLRSGQKLLVPRTNQLVSCTGTPLLERRDPTAEGVSRTHKRARHPNKERADGTSLPPREALLVCRAEALTRAVQDRLFCAELSAGLAAGRAVFRVAGSAPLFQRLLRY
ncbi:hypothetical protein NDU88_004832 [Pleurodeles waltl]|uniref:Secreted protein n=1 Tax=Pleurodeles waltl TaxID=8319 RepID=A0AAV7PM12_PLEWA|nr:hypothetical protein NDU88_004832 [Pleurodeles waltl]